MAVGLAHTAMDQADSVGEDVIEVSKIYVIESAS
jgi:hypothetical protein